MTRQEHFEQWMRHNYPNIHLKYYKESDCYTGEAFLPYQAWKEAPLRRPCEKGQVTKEQLKAMKENDDPKTIVDRLNGWYGQTTEPYVVPKVQKEAAREIERLRAELKGMGELFQKKVDDCAELDVGTHREIERLRGALRPFAAYASHYPKERKYGNRVTTGEWHSVESGQLGRAQIDVEDFHRAAALINNKNPAEAG